MDKRRGSYSFDNSVPTISLQNNSNLLGSHQAMPSQSQLESISKKISGVVNSVVNKLPFTGSSDKKLSKNVSATNSRPFPGQSSSKQVVPSSGYEGSRSRKKVKGSVQQKLEVLKSKITPKEKFKIDLSLSSASHCPVKIKSKLESCKLKNKQDKEFNNEMRANSLRVKAKYAT